MSKKKNDGGPAFASPSVYTDDGAEQERGSEGMSLRDYFAAMAMSGFMHHQGWIGYHAESAGDGGNHRAFLMKSYAQDSYAMADAMLAERGAK